MPATLRAQYRARPGGLFALLVGAMLAGSALSQPAGVDPKAEELLKASTTFLADQAQFTVDTRSTIEGVLASGQKLQFDHATALAVRRPDRLRAERRGDLVDQVLHYDGKSLTLSNPDGNYYATTEAPATLEEMLDFARESLDIVAPAGDLIYTNAFDILMEDVTSGFVVGKSLVEGVWCDHLAFRAPHVDWQIWIQEGDKPLPRKLVITSTDVVGAPQFSVVMTEWDLAPRLGDDLFEHTPAKGAKKIDFLTLDEGGSPSFQKGSE